MAVFNEERFLAESVESVLAQSFGDFELIIADDGSTDATPAIARALAERDPERIRLLRSERNRGKPFVLNEALSVCAGELIAWLDGDDVMLPSKLERQVQALDGDPSAAGCTHDAEMFDAFSGRVIGRFSQIANGSPLRSGGVELWFDPTYRMLPSATMIRASLRPPGGFDERLTYTNDWLFDIEVFRHGSCIAIDRYPQLQRRARTISAAVMLGQARRHVRAGDWRAASRYAKAACGIGGVEGRLAGTPGTLRPSFRRLGSRP